MKKLEEWIIKNLSQDQIERIYKASDISGISDDQYFASILDIYENYWRTNQFNTMHLSNREVIDSIVDEVINELQEPDITDEDNDPLTSNGE
jgi:hypothetical protein